MRLKELREEKGITQKEVANAIQCSSKTYSNYETGRRQPDIATLKNISRYFEKPIDYIVCNDEWRAE